MNDTNDLAAALLSLPEDTWEAISFLRKVAKTTHQDNLMTVMSIVLEEAAEARAEAAGYKVQHVSRGLLRLALPGERFENSAPMTAAEILADLDLTLPEGE